MKANMKSEKLLVKCVEEDEEEHPRCPHGPTLLFYRGSLEQPDSGFYACAAFRDKSDCSFYLELNETKKESDDKEYKINTTGWKEKRVKWHQLPLKERCYCHTCNEPIFLDERVQHKKHEIVTGVQDKHLKDPTYFLKPLSDVKSQAQYFFDDKALKYLQKCFQTFEFNKIICMGAPRLHYYLRQNEYATMESFLLDFDKRFFYFSDDQEYGWYNMCNNWFFDESQKQEFHNFLKTEYNERILIVTDPPFGCRTEPIASSIRQITRLYNRLNNFAYKPLSVFWIFPYFSEHYIQSVMPELTICDYMVNYTNHIAYTDLGKKSRFQGSPVRIFTNVPQNLMPLPDEPEYIECDSCQRFVHKINRHCNICNTCPSKNGGRYHHCAQCGQCVKINYQHCSECRRCTQKEGHDCTTYQKYLHCWICRQQGHTEFDCAQWQEVCKAKNLPVPVKNPFYGLTCLLCGTKGHNEKACKRRSEFIEETEFLGEKTLTFK